MFSLLVGEVGEEALKLLKREGPLNTKRVAVLMGKNYHHIRDVLFELKRKGLVDNEPVRRFTPLTRSWTLVNEWYITKTGEEYLKRLESGKVGGAVKR